MDSLGRIRLWNPPIHADLVHDLIAELPKEHRHTTGVDQLCQSVSIHRRLRSRRTREHPQSFDGSCQIAQVFPPHSLGVLVRRCLVHHDEIEAAVRDLFLDDADTIEVNDNKLGPSVNNLFALLG